MSARTYKVVHVGTGVTGKCGLNALLNQPDMQLVGHLVFDPAKVGADAGALCELGYEVGVEATSNVDDLIALRPDFINYFGDGQTKFDQSYNLIKRFLEAGINVGTPSIYAILHSKSADPELIKPLEEACRKGNSSLFISGIDPGYASPWLAVGLLKSADEVSEIRMQEIADYSFYDVEWVMREIYGMGKPLGSHSTLSDGSFMRWVWTPTINAVADRMGIELDEIRTFFDGAVHDERIDTLWGPIEPGTLAAVRFGLEGIYQGKPLIILDHITRCALDVAPHWPQAKGGEIEKLRHEYTVLIKGNPNLDLRLAMGETREGYDAGLTTTANVIVNAIPLIVSHQAGIIDELEFPVYSTRNIKV